MKKEFRCCFAGHNNINISTEKEKVKEVAENLILQYGVKDFWVGNYGNFDIGCALAIKELQVNYPDIKLSVVIPYLTKSISEYKEVYYKNFDNVLIANIPLSVPKRFHIIKANEYMVENSQFLICFINRSWGGAVQTFEYAKRKNLKIFNLATKTAKEENF